MPYVPPKLKPFSKQRLLILAVAAIAIAIAAFSMFRDLQRDPYSPTLIWSLILFSLVGFAIRQRWRLWYGGVEWTLGSFITAYPFLLTINQFKSGIPVDTQAVLVNLEWAREISGMYFMIRGLDNIGKAFKAEKAKADEYNHMIDSAWNELVGLEAHKLWIERGQKTGSEEADWKDAELNVHRQKKFTPIVDLWGKWIGFD